MEIHKLAHYSIRTYDLDASRKFYQNIMGMREGYRPPFKFPGIWFYLGEDESDFGVVHIIGVDENDPNGLKEYLGDKTDLEGTGTVDHIAFISTGLKKFHETLRAENWTWTDRTVPSLGLHQVFVTDPSGVVIEMNFPADEAKDI